MYEHATREGSNAGVDEYFKHRDASNCTSTTGLRITVMVASERSYLVSRQNLLPYTGSATFDYEQPFILNYQPICRIPGYVLYVMQTIARQTQATGSGDCLSISYMLAGNAGGAATERTFFFLGISPTTSFPDQASGNEQSNPPPALQQGHTDTAASEIGKCVPAHLQSTLCRLTDGRTIRHNFMQIVQHVPTPRMLIPPKLPRKSAAYYPRS
jgi:hypothetical protein